MSTLDPEFLVFGHDTVEAAYPLAPIRGREFDFVGLMATREELRQSKRRGGKPVVLGDGEFMLAGHGTNSGYPLLLANRDFTIQCGEFNSPSFFVKFSSEALWRDGAVALHGEFLAWAESAGLFLCGKEKLSRVDFAFDYHLPCIDFDEENFVTDSEKTARYSRGGRPQTFTLGKSDVVLRVYDKVAEIGEKSGKRWFFDLWGRDDEVWRIEWQVRKEVLRRFGLRTFADLADQQGDALTWLAEEHDSLRVVGTDSNRSRWQVHSLWSDLRRKISGLGRQGVIATIDTGPPIEERLSRIAASLYGYHKQIAALYALKDGRAMIEHAEALRRVEVMVARLHDRLTWRVDVQDRMDKMRLGQW